MNDSFLHLPEDKRNTIINAALKVFSEHGYKKSPMNEIAAEAGISKSLLFYYFKNKKELYLFLTEYCAEVTKHEMMKHDCFGKSGFFEVLTSGLNVKVKQMRDYPELALFEIRVFFENEPELKADFKARIDSYSQFEIQKDLMLLDLSEFIEGLDLEMMYKNIFLVTEGFFWEFLNSEDITPDRLEHEYMQFIDHWKRIYLRKEASS